MQVAEGVDIENIGEAWRKEHISWEAGEHMPWITKQKRGDEVYSCQEPSQLLQLRLHRTYLTEGRSQCSQKDTVRGVEERLEHVKGGMNIGRIERSL